MALDLPRRESFQVENQVGNQVGNDFGWRPQEATRRAAQWATQQARRLAVPDNAVTDNAVPVEMPADIQHTLFSSVIARQAHKATSRSPPHRGAHPQ
jgi:hypothetical protein